MRLPRGGESCRPLTCVTFTFFTDDGGQSLLRQVKIRLVPDSDSQAPSSPAYLRTLRLLGEYSDNVQNFEHVSLPTMRCHQTTSLVETRQDLAD